jgi:hypothetical protein
MSFVDILPTTAAPVIAGTDDITRTERLPSFSGGREVMRETWEGPRAKVLAKYAALLASPGIESLTLAQGSSGGKLALIVEWRSGGGESEAGTGDDERWSIEKLEIPAALATHPYFQLPYIPASGIEFAELIARVDQAIAAGDSKPPLITEQAGYQTYLDRYWGHVLAGVQEYPKMGIHLTREFRAVSVGEITGYCQFVGQVRTIAQIQAPANYAAIISSFRSIKSYATSDPTSPTYQSSKFEFLQLPPGITGPTKGPWDVRFEWWGVDKWSRVLYPSGTWDPGTEGAQWPE